MEKETQEVIEKIKLFEKKLDEIQEAVNTAKTEEDISEIKSAQNEVKEMQKELKKRLEKLDTVEKKMILGSQDKSERQVMEDTVKFFKAYKVGDFETVKILGDGTDTEGGGYLVPVGYSNRLFEIAREYGIIRRLATVIPMATPELNFPKLDDSTLVFDYVGAGAKKPLANASFGRINLKTLKVAGILPITEELIADANVDIMTILTRAMARAMAKFEDTEAFYGVGEPDAFEGIFENSYVPVVSFASGKTKFKDIKTEYEKLSELMDSIDPAFLKNARFAMNPKIVGYLRTAKDGDGRLFWSPATAGTPENIWNYPVERTEVLPAPGGTEANKKFVVFGDFSNIYFGQRQGLAVKMLDQATLIGTDVSSSVSLAQQDMIGIRAVERIAIKIAEPTAFAVLKTAASTTS